MCSFGQLQQLKVAWFVEVHLPLVGDDERSRSTSVSPRVCMTSTSEGELRRNSQVALTWHAQLETVVLPESEELIVIIEAEVMVPTSCYRLNPRS